MSTITLQTERPKWWRRPIAWWRARHNTYDYVGHELEFNGKRVIITEYNGKTRTATYTPIEEKPLPGADESKVS